jgi:hypothetical protein
MKPLPAPNMPGDTPAEWLSNALNRVLRASKADLRDLRKEEARLRRASEKKKKRGQKETRFLTPPNLARLLYLRVLAAICSNRWIITFVLRI